MWIVGRCLCRDSWKSKKKVQFGTFSIRPLAILSVSGRYENSQNIKGAPVTSLERSTKKLLVVFISDHAGEFCIRETGVEL